MKFMKHNEKKICIMGIPRGEKKKGKLNIFKAIIAKISQTEG